MPIEFSQERWERLEETYGRWWSGSLERPIVPVELVGRDPLRDRPAAPLLSQATCHDFSIPPEDIIDRLDYELSTRLFLGDAFPFVNLKSFGPGVAAAFLGAHLDNSSGQVWFLAPEDVPITKLHFNDREGGIWLARIKDICAAAMARWDGKVLVAMPDLGGVLDMLSTFRPGEKLLLDLYDNPDEVKRLTWELHDAWHGFYAEIDEVLGETNPGHSDWSGLYSSEPSYMLQCDFSYMISPEMFAEFVKPELTASCGKLVHAFYHMDGPGQLSHLDHLLSIEGLDGIQWIPGAGAPGCEHWSDVYKSINESGKRIQLGGSGFGTLDVVINQIGTGRGLQHTVFQRPIAEEGAVRRELAKYGIE
ncbi:hypothetical protein ACFL1X_07770 [Candidatus Hydrogenedentota bacterium]